MSFRAFFIMIESADESCELTAFGDFSFLTLAISFFTGE